MCLAHDNLLLSLCWASDTSLIGATEVSEWRKNVVHTPEREGATELGISRGSEAPSLRFLQGGLQIHPNSHGHLQPSRRRRAISPPLRRRRRDPQALLRHQP